MKRTAKENNEVIHFDAHATNYDKNYKYDSLFTKYKINKKITEFKSLVKEIYGNKPIKILEIGCGTGEYTKKLANSFPKSKIVALDISPNILRIAKLKCKGLPNVSFVCKSAYDTRFKENSFDIIVGYYVLHHIDIKKFNKEASRIVKPSGYLFFYEPNILNPIVYIIKSIKFIKKMVGDSPDEWAVNPLTISNQLSSFNVVELSTTEFILPIKKMDVKIMIFLDRILSYLKLIPIINLFGGSVKLVYRK